jgi:hypothetical protein
MPTQPELPDFQKMSCWEQFFDSPAVKVTPNLMGHGYRLSKMGVTFQQFKQVLRNKEQFEKMISTEPKKPKTVAA